MQKKKKNKRQFKIDYSLIDELVKLEEKHMTHLKKSSRSGKIRDIRTKLYVILKLNILLPDNKVKCPLCSIERHFSAFHFDHVDNNGKEKRKEIYKKLGWKEWDSEKPSAGPKFIQALILTGKEEFESAISRMRIICACCHSEKNYSGGQTDAVLANAELRKANVS